MLCTLRFHVVAQSWIMDESECWALKTGLDAEYHVTHAKYSILHLGPTTNSVRVGGVISVLSTTGQFHVNQEKTGEEFALIHALYSAHAAVRGVCRTCTCATKAFAALF